MSSTDRPSPHHPQIDRRTHRCSLLAYLTIGHCPRRIRIPTSKFNEPPPSSLISHSDSSIYIYIYIYIYSRAQTRTHTWKARPIRRPARSSRTSLPASAFIPLFRFHPTDEELVVHYLKKKATTAPLPVAIIAQVALCFNLWGLPEIIVVLEGDRNGQVGAHLRRQPESWREEGACFLQREVAERGENQLDHARVSPGREQSQLQATQL